MRNFSREIAELEALEAAEKMNEQKLNSRRVRKYGDEQ